MSNKRPRSVSDAELLLFLSRTPAAVASPEEEEGQGTSLIATPATTSSSNAPTTNADYVFRCTAQRAREVVAAAAPTASIVSSSESESDSDDSHDEDEDDLEECYKSVAAERERACRIFDFVFAGEDFEKYTSFSPSSSNKKSRIQ